MRKIIAMIGEPATGKSTLMKRFIADTTHQQHVWEEQELTKLVPTLYSPDMNLHILGRYPADEPFGGTDRFSMAVQPQAIKFVQDTNANILFEGDRLGNQSFLEFLADQPMTDFKLLVITADDAIVDARHIDRKDSQTDVFKKGRKTKIENLRSNMVLMGYVETFKNENLHDQTLILQYLKSQLV